jgi:Protein of unknown function (DUF3086)
MYSENLPSENLPAEEKNILPPLPSDDGDRDSVPSDEMMEELELELASTVNLSNSGTNTNIADIEAEPILLQRSLEQLKSEIELLKTAKQEILESQVQELQAAIERVTQESLGDLEKRKQELQSAISLLQRKQERLQNEMKTTYAGVSQDIAIRVQGFKDYLVGSLQDLVANAEKLELLPPKQEQSPEPVVVAAKQPEPQMLAEQAFESQKQKVEQLLERYRTLPDYYGPPWKLRRTFEQAHAERVSNWFLAQAGRGAIRSMGTRLQNILVSAAVVSVLRVLYSDKVRVLVLATSPERLGEWRRGFQDCLGISRDNFGPEKGVVLFEDPEPLTLKGDRLVSDGLMPLVIIDEAEEYIAVDLLRFPLLLAFGRDPFANTSYSSRDRDRDFRDF